MCTGNMRLRGQSQEQAVAGHAAATAAAYAKELLNVIPGQQVASSRVANEVVGLQDTGKVFHAHGPVSFRTVFSEARTFAPTRPFVPGNYKVGAPAQSRGPKLDTNLTQTES